MIEIRRAVIADSLSIMTLLESLGYPGTGQFIKTRIAQLSAHPDAELLVAIEDTEVVGVISLHFIPQIALAGDICRISYFCVASAARNKGIGSLLELRAVDLARRRGCDRIEVHCHSRREAAHRFYCRQGYVESPEYLVKSLT